MWQYYGQERPPFAEQPGRGQESVWDFPRPPRVDHETRVILVRSKDGQVLARTSSALRLCETASPPQFYVPMNDVDLTLIEEVPGSSFCEWKGRARYWGLRQNSGQSIGWDYPDVDCGYSDLKDHMAFYPGGLLCSVGGEAVVPQPGAFYGGWITSDLSGPFKGDPGTGHW